MKFSRPLLRIGSALFFTTILFSAHAQHEACGTHLHHAPTPANWGTQQLHKTASQDTFIIPTVVHVVHSGATPPITVADVERYFHYLHEDFRNLPGSRAWGATPDMHVEFQLATRDPLGNPHSGVNFVQSSLADISVSFPSSPGDDNYALKNLSRWDTTRYFNLWVVNQITQPGVGILAGYAQYPWDDRPETDGVVIKFNNFGIATYNFTTTHEIGHWLGLIHPFDSAGCVVGSCQTTGDKVCDTPTSEFIFKQDATRHNFCSIEETQGAENPRNYMDYIALDVNRPNHFTPGQVARMRGVLQNPNLPRRKNLSTPTNLQATGCGRHGRVRAYFWAPLQRIETGETLRFQSYCMGQPHLYEWEFAGGTPATSSDPTPSVSWSAPGTYTVRLIVQNESGRRDTLTRTNFIAVAAAQNRTVVSEDFSDFVTFPPAGWTTISQDVVSLSQPTWEQEPTAGNFGLNDGAAMMDCHANQNRFTRDWLITPPVTLAQSNAALLFYYAYSPLNVQQTDQQPWVFTDTLRVQLSNDVGTTWHTLLTLGGQDLMTTAAINTLVNNPADFRYLPTVEEEWREQVVNLTPWAGQRVRICFEVQNGFGNRFFLDDVAVATREGVARPQPLATTHFTLYPNPAGQVCKVQTALPLEQSTQLTIRDAQGKVAQQQVWPAGQSAVHLPVAALPAGLYWVEIPVAGRVQRLRFIRQ